MAEIFLCSDHHFAHRNIWTFTDEVGVPIRSPYTYEEGEPMMVERWNSVVRPNDHVWHLGDFTIGSKKGMEFGRRLNGHKRIVLGNHDLLDPRVWRDSGFEKVCGPHKLDTLWLTHAPTHPAHIPKWADGNCHGHLHQNPSPPGPYFNVSVERISFTPVTLGEVKERLRALREVQP